MQGVGPAPCDILLVGEASGFSEEKTGKPFSGKSGAELTRYLHQIGIDRNDCYVTNVCKERPFTRSLTGNNQPSAEEIKRDEPELVEEIATVRPRFIGAIGAVAARWLLGSRWDTMEAFHGLSFPLSDRRTKQCGLNSRPTVVPMYHVAAGLHSPEQQPAIFFDFEAFGKYVRSELPLTTPVDEYSDPDYFEVQTSSVRLMKTMPVYIDTEGLLGRPWGLSYTQLPGQAAVIRKHNRKALASFREQLRGSHVIMHHALHDLPIIAELLGMSLSEFLSHIGRFDDTMVKAYVLRTVPLALKAAGRRYHGMAMEDYLDVVRDADRVIASVYLKTLLRSNVCTECTGVGERVVYPVSEKTGKALQPCVENCPTCEGDGTSLPSPEETIEVVDGEAKVRRGQRIGRRARNILRDLRTKPDETNPRTRWEAIDYEYRVRVEDVAGEMRPVSLDDVEPQERAITYSARDADTTIRYDRTLDAMLASESKLRSVYEIDRAMLPMLARMMEIGTHVDIPHLNRLAARLDSENDKALYQLQRLAGRPINPASSKQVAELLFEDWRLPTVAQTKGGDESTADKVLEDLKLQVAEMVESRKRTKMLVGLGLITGHRERTKLKGAYAVKLPRVADKNGRVHTTFTATNVESGRVAAREPPLHQIPDPNKGELGGLVRTAFDEVEGYTLVECDFSQVELRFAAHDSGDEAMCRVFNEDRDLHSQTAAMVFGVPLSNFDKPMAAAARTQRRAAKTLNFSMLYGISAQSLSARIKIETGIDVSVEECAGYIDRLLNVAYPGVGMWILEQHAFARRYGYSECMFGRRRYLPGMHSAINSVKAESERIAVNHRDQASCAGIMKKSAPVIMDEVLPYVRRKGWDCDPLLTVHDSFLMRVKAGGEELLIDGLKRAMSGVVELRVPLTVDGHSGSNWAACK